MLTPKQHFLNRKNIIEKAGYTQISFSASISMSRIGLYKAISCKTKNKNTQEVICNALGVSKEVFWPEFHGETETVKNETDQHNAPQCF